jgi:NitT/TauT family transport system substrate-binding protein
MTIKRFALPLIILLLSVFTTAASAADLKTLRVAHDFWVGYAGFYVAMEKGFFKDAGVNVDEKKFNTPADGLPALLTGDVDIHLSTLDTFLTALDRDPNSIKVVTLVDSSAGADALIAKKSIADIAALKGKTIGVSLGQANHMLLLKALDSKRLSVRDVKLVNLNGDDAGNAFAAGKLDAAVSWEPFITQGLSRGGHVLYSTVDAPDFIVNAVGLKPETLAKKRPEVIAFIKAFSRGTEWALENRTGAADIVAKALEQEPAAVAEMMSKDRLYKRSDSLALMGTAASPGKVLGTTEFIAKFLLDNKIIRKPVDVSTFFDSSVLQEAK